MYANGVTAKLNKQLLLWQGRCAAKEGMPARVEINRAASVAAASLDRHFVSPLSSRQIGELQADIQQCGACICACGNGLWQIFASATK